MKPATLHASSPLTGSGVDQAPAGPAAIGVGEMTLAGVLSLAVISLWRIVLPRYREVERQNKEMNEKLMKLSVEVASLRGELDSKVLQLASSDKIHAAEVARIAAERAKYKADSEGMAMRNAQLCGALRDAGVDVPDLG